MASFQINSALRQLGSDIEVARKKRRMSVADFCERIGVSDKTLKKLERGDGGVRIETLAMALLALGMLDRLRELVDPGTDEAGLSLDISRLPQRIHRVKPKSKAKPTTQSGLKPIDRNDEGTGF